MAHGHDFKLRQRAAHQPAFGRHLEPDPQVALVHREALLVDEDPQAGRGVGVDEVRQTFQDTRLHHLKRAADPHLGVGRRAGRLARETAQDLVFGLLGQRGDLRAEGRRHPALAFLDEQRLAQRLGHPRDPARDGGDIRAQKARGIGHRSAAVQRETKFHVVPILHEMALPPPVPAKSYARAGAGRNGKPDRCLISTGLQTPARRASEAGTSRLVR